MGAIEVGKLKALTKTHWPTWTIECIMELLSAVKVRGKSFAHMLNLFGHNFFFFFFLIYHVTNFYDRFPQTIGSSSKKLSQMLLQQENITYQLCCASL